MRNTLTYLDGFSVGFIQDELEGSLYLCPLSYLLNALDPMRMDCPEVELLFNK